MTWFSPRALLKQNTVRQNLSANLATKVLSALVSLFCAPIYIGVLGASGYGLIGVWTTLETVAQLLDLGVTPTITRELAASSARQDAAQDARNLVRTLEVGYWVIGVLLGAAVVASAPLIATHWLASSHLSTRDIHSALVLIGILVLCRWPLSFYAGGLTGTERQVLLSWVTLVFTCVRSLGAVCILIFISPTVFAFFVWQIVINVAQTAALVVLLWRCLPVGAPGRFRLDLVRRVWKYAGGVTAVSLLNILLSDVDKLTLSRMLSLEDFGYYSLAARIAGTLYMASSPVFAGLFPAFSRFAASEHQGELAALYHKGAQVMSVLVFPTAITVMFFARPLIFAWTGSSVIAQQTSLIAALLTVGTAFNCVVLIPVSLQLAHGWTSLAFWTNLAYVFIAVPLLIVLTKHFGGAGAAAVWLALNASYLATQVPLMHRRLLRGEARKWYVEDLGIPLFASVAVAMLVSAIVGTPTTRAGAAFVSFVAGAAITMIALLATPFGRRQVWVLFTQRPMRPAP